MVRNTILWTCKTPSSQESSLRSCQSRGKCVTCIQLQYCLHAHQIRQHRFVHSDDRPGGRVSDGERIRASVPLKTTANCSRQGSKLHPLRRAEPYAEDEDRAGLIHQTPSLSALKNLSQQVVPWIQGKRQKLQGWRFGVSRSAWLATAVLVFNTLITIAAVATFGSEDGLGTAYTVCLKSNSFAMNVDADKT